MQCCTNSRVVCPCLRFIVIYLTFDLGSFLIGIGAAQCEQVLLTACISKISLSRFYSPDMGDMEPAEKSAGALGHLVCRHMDSNFLLCGTVSQFIEM